MSEAWAGGRAKGGGCAKGCGCAKGGRGGLVKLAALVCGNTCAGGGGLLLCVCVCACVCVGGGRCCWCLHVCAYPPWVLAHPRYNHTLTLTLGLPATT